jgi:hypothetical protein
VCDIACGNIFAIELLELFFGKVVEVKSNDIVQTAGSLSFRKGRGVKLTRLPTGWSTAATSSPTVLDTSIRLSFSNRSERPWAVVTT